MRLAHSSNIDLDSVAAEPAGEVNSISPDKEDAETHSEIMDSGCTCHLTPNRQDLANYIDIAPRTFRAVNKRSMDAIGKGEMSVTVPNGTGDMKLRLTDVLYVPQVGYTLVSVGQLDKAGYIVTFGGGKCALVGPDGK